MTETIYEKKQVIKDTLPNNRRQIGQPGQGAIEVFIEDYAFSFAKSLSERDYTGCVVGVLVGEYVEGARDDKILVRGVLEARNVMKQETVCFTEDNWTEIYRDIKEYFPTQKIVGWFLGGPGFLLEDTDRQKKIQEDNFGGGDKILLKIDSVEKEKKILIYRDGSLQELPGYYIYYERNAQMQTYMAETKRIPPKEERNEIVIKPKKEEAVQEVKQQAKTAHDINPGRFYRLFYATGGILTCMAVLVIAGLAMQIRERNQLKEMLNQQERLVSSLQRIHVVEKGETIETICIRFYGSTEQEEAIRLLNGLQQEEEPEEGQKIFLP